MQFSDPTFYSNERIFPPSSTTANFTMLEEYIIDNDVNNKITYEIILDLGNIKININYTILNINNINNIYIYSK